MASGSIAFSASLHRLKQTSTVSLQCLLARSKKQSKIKKHGDPELSKAAASRKKLKIGVPIQSVEIVLAASGPPENPKLLSRYQQSKATSFQFKMCTSTMRRRRRSRGFSHRLIRILHRILADAHASKGHLGWFNQDLKKCVPAAKATTRGRGRINSRLTNLSLRLRHKVRRHWYTVPTCRDTKRLSGKSDNSNGARQNRIF